MLGHVCTVPLSSLTLIPYPGLQFTLDQDSGPWLVFSSLVSAFCMKFKQIVQILCF